MEILSSQFLAALAAIVVIDLVLAGDNAIVIALAARNLEPRLRRLAIVWGTFGAIGVRAAMTVIVVWLLKIPGLMLFGGLMLVWIAYRLLVPKDSGGEHGHEVKAASGFWPAMGTIVIADAMMGLDNVLAVAGAAHGSYLLVVLGLLISIPIVVWGSQLVLKLIDRYPAIVYLGAGVLALTAAKMITDEPYIKLALSDRRELAWMVYIGLGAGVLALAFLRNQFRKQDRLEAKLIDSAAQPGAPAARVARVLIPVDGSRNFLEALRKFSSGIDPKAQPEIHLLNVRGPLSRHVAGFLRRSDIAAWQRDEGMKALKGAMALLNERGLTFAHHVREGDKARTIADLADELECDQIVMATARRNSLTRIVEDSVTARVLELTRVPVEVMPGTRSSRIESIAVPACMSAVVALLLSMTLVT